MGFIIEIEDKPSASLIVQAIRDFRASSREAPVVRKSQ
jgi:hypothetical protein